MRQLKIRVDADDQTGGTERIFLYQPMRKAVAKGGSKTADAMKLKSSATSTKTLN